MGEEAAPHTAGKGIFSKAYNGVLKPIVNYTGVPVLVVGIVALFGWGGYLSERSKAETYKTFGALERALDSNKDGKIDTSELRSLISFADKYTDFTVSPEHGRGFQFNLKRSDGVVDKVYLSNETVNEFLKKGY